MRSYRAGWMVVMLVTVTGLLLGSFPLEAMEFAAVDFGSYRATTAQTRSVMVLLPVDGDAIQSLEFGLESALAAGDESPGGGSFRP